MRTLEHLAQLVGCDTQNPPRAIATDGKLFAYLGTRLAAAGFAITLSDHGAGCVALFATRGAPRWLFNFHVDTVPAVRFAGDPFVLRSDGERATGLGACDVKGAIAAMLEAVESTRGGAALLFTSDEESGDDRCVKQFLAALASGACDLAAAARAASGRPWPDGVIVAEPTGCRAVLGHRGMATASGVFGGTGGHASADRALADSAVHEAVRWAARALTVAEEERGRERGGLTGIRFNLGTIAGGTKTNIIADRAELRFGVRSRPGEDPVELVARLQALAPDPSRVAWQLGFVGPSLPAPGDREGAVALAASLGLTVAAPVDFWSEASLFAAAGFPSLVYGPGDIAQAHAADEWVATAALAEATFTYRRWLAV